MGMQTERDRRPRILLLVGTRPEAIKMAPVVLELRAHDDEFETCLCSTGQHREMLQQALDAFGLRPDIDLALMKREQSLVSLSARALAALDGTMSGVQPDIVVVQGDTATAMVGALGAYYHRIPVAHLEAGLRTGDLLGPFPEEGNRRLISAITTLHFAPTPGAGRRLQREGVPARHVLVTGNTVIDALLAIRDRLPRGRGRARWSSPGKRLVLLTTHRRESFGRPLEDVCAAVLQLVERNPDVELIFPVHASPFVREPVTRLLGGHPRIRLIEPLGYEEFVALLDACHFVLTDSGGIQEEAPALGKPVLVLREKTERPESIKAGTSRLVGTNPRRLLRAAEELLRNEESYLEMARAENPYGDGRAARRVVAALRWHFGLSAHGPADFGSGPAAGASEGLVA
jgi:UDP-N-acetylglucosamine 2-epimerase (non-hydrolysing)